MMHVEPQTHFQDITLLVSNIKLPYMFNMLHLIMDTAAHLQPWKLRSQKQNSGTALYFIMGQKSTIPL
jgi:hypothetical protein